MGTYHARPHTDTGTGGAVSVWQRMNGFPDTDDPVVRADKFRRQIRHWTYIRDRIESDGAGAYPYTRDYAEQRIAYWTGKLIEEAG